MPPIENCTSDNYTCGTDRNNIIDVFYFDVADTFSCKLMVINCIRMVLLVIAW